MMKVIEILSVITDETRVCLWEDGELVAEYDGREAIDKKYNNKLVKSISAGLFKIDMEI